MGSGSPLEARQYSFIYVFIAVVLVVLFVLSVIAMIILKTKKSRNSKEWLEKERKRETKKSDIASLGHYAQLNAEEKNLLWNICHRNHSRNIEYLYRETDELDVLFKGEYERLSSMDDVDESVIETLFSIRYKLENALYKRNVFSSTKGLLKDAEITLYDAERQGWTVKVMRTSPEIGFFVNIPAELYNRESKPKPLSKFLIMFTVENGGAYKAVVRCTRYEKQANGDMWLLISHSSTLKIIHRRLAKRMTMNDPCTFSAMRAVTYKNKETFEVLDKRYPGILGDISASGCKIFCGMPIQQGQFIQVHFRLFDSDEMSAGGVIVSTKKMSKENRFVLHIKFNEIEQSIKNRIYASSYNYI